MLRIACHGDGSDEQCSVDPPNGLGRAAEGRIKEFDKGGLEARHGGKTCRPSQSRSVLLAACQRLLQLPYSRGTGSHSPTRLCRIVKVLPARNAYSSVLIFCNRGAQRPCLRRTPSRTLASC